MKITEVYPEYVFQRLGKGLTVDCVDYRKKQYIDLKGVSVQMVQNLLTRQDVKFFQLEEETETKEA